MAWVLWSVVGPTEYASVSHWSGCFRNQLRVYNNIGYLVCFRKVYTDSNFNVWFLYMHTVVCEFVALWVGLYLCYWYVKSFPGSAYSSVCFIYLCAATYLVVPSNIWHFICNMITWIHVRFQAFHCRHGEAYLFDKVYVFFAFPVLKFYELDYGTVCLILFKRRLICYLSSHSRLSTCPAWLLRIF